MECLDAEVPDKVEMLEVLWHDGRIHLAGTFNRRLCVWRLLAICFPETLAESDSNRYASEAEQAVKIRLAYVCDEQELLHRENADIAEALRRT